MLQTRYNNVMCFGETIAVTEVRKLKTRWVIKVLQTGCSNGNFSGKQSAAVGVQNRRQDGRRSAADRVQQKELFGETIRNIKDAKIESKMGDKSAADRVQQGELFGEKIHNSKEAKAENKMGDISVADRVQQGEFFGETICSSRDAKLKVKEMVVPKVKKIEDRAVVEPS